MLPRLPLMFSPSFLQNVTTELAVGETDQTIMGKITAEMMENTSFWVSKSYCMLHVYLLSIPELILAAKITQYQAFYATTPHPHQRKLLGNSNLVWGDGPQTLPVFCSYFLKFKFTVSMRKKRTTNKVS